MDMTTAIQNLAEHARLSLAVIERCAESTALLASPTVHAQAILDLDAATEQMSKIANRLEAEEEKLEAGIARANRELAAKEGVRKWEEHLTA